MLTWGTISVGIGLTLAKAFDLIYPTAPINLGGQWDVKNGTGDNQANEFYNDAIDLAGSGNTTLDLNGTTLKNIYGEDLQLTKVKAMFIRNPVTNPHAVRIGGAAANAFQGWFDNVNDKELIHPGGFSLHIHPLAGWTVTAATADQFFIENTGGNALVGVEVNILGVK